MKLNAKIIEQAEPADKEYLLSDGDKLYLRVRPGGGKSWQFNYISVEGKRVKLALGPYPEISLAGARELAAEQRRHLAIGKDPRVRKIEVRQEAVRQALATFEKVAREWHAHANDVHEWSESYSQKILRQLELHAFPRLGRHPINTLNQMDVLQCLEAISLAGTRETAIRLRESLQRIYARAVTVGVLEPSKNFMAKGVADFKLRTPKALRHHARPYQDRATASRCQRIYGALCCLLRLADHALCVSASRADTHDGVGTARPGSRDLDLPASHHENAGSTQARCSNAITYRSLTSPSHRDSDPATHVTGPYGPVFKSVSRRRGKKGYSRYISNNTMNSALGALGYDTQQDITGHGFRAMARTLLREKLGWDRELIEKHLAHMTDEELGEAYDRTRFIEQRHTMAQAWADYLDQLAENKIPSVKCLTPSQILVANRVNIEDGLSAPTRSLQ